MDCFYDSASDGKNGELKTKADFVNNMQLGNNIAFNVDSESGVKMLAGKVIKIQDEMVAVRTKNGSIFYVKKDKVVWVRIGARWPLGIYNALNFYSDKRK